MLKSNKVIYNLRSEAFLLLQEVNIEWNRAASSLLVAVGSRSPDVVWLQEADVPLCYLIPEFSPTRVFSDVPVHLLSALGADNWQRDK